MSYLGREAAKAPLTSADIPDDSITGAKIVDDAIDSEHYAAGSVDAAHVAADVATQAELDAITDAAYNDNVIQTNTALLAFKTHQKSFSARFARRILESEVHTLFGVSRRRRRLTRGGVAKGGGCSGQECTRPPPGGGGGGGGEGQGGRGSRRNTGER